MEKNLSALGFMSGTSGDGVDSSVISSNGKDSISIKYNRFDTYPSELSNKIHRIKEYILKSLSISVMFAIPPIFNIETGILTLLSFNKVFISARW